MAPAGPDRAGVATTRHAELAEGRSQPQISVSRARHTSDNFLDAQSLQGQITSSGIYTGNVGLGVADFLLGDVSTASFTTPTIVHNYQLGYSFFIQDTWRVRPNLTINLGLRYELFSPLLNHQNAISNFINDAFVYSHQR